MRGARRGGADGVRGPVRERRAVERVDGGRAAAFVGGYTTSACESVPRGGGGRRPRGAQTLEFQGTGSHVRRHTRVFSLMCASYLAIGGARAAFITIASGRTLRRVEPPSSPLRAGGMPDELDTCHDATLAARKAADAARGASDLPVRLRVERPTRSFANVLFRCRCSPRVPSSPRSRCGADARRGGTTSPSRARTPPHPPPSRSGARRVPLPRPPRVARPRAMPRRDVRR